MYEPMDQAHDRLNVGPRTALRCDVRSVDDDFFCQRYQVWYPSLDCAVRTRFRTCPACARCDQGRFNAKRHAAALARIRFARTDAT